MFTIQTAVTIVTAGLANSIFGDVISVEIWTLIILLLSFFMLLIGEYKTLDKLIKYLIIALTMSTILSFIFAAANFSKPVDIKQVFPIDSVGIIFLIAFMGWMPAPLDVSIWNSLWTIEKRKQQKNYSFSNSLFDFNLGYFGTAILGVCFIGVGYFTINGTEEILSESAGIFSTQLIHLYTDNLGNWSYYLIAFAAFSTMLSTTITALDASPRAMGITTELIFNKKIKYAYLFWLIILLLGTIIIFFGFTSQMGLLIKIATILSFLTAPFYAIINYLLISSKHTPKKNRPSNKMHILSILGIFYLLGFSLFFLIKGI
jgi:Mn2+/Fe2+ NRAMP family transporter